MTTQYENLLRAAERLLEQHEKWMPKEDDWNALRTAVEGLRPGAEDELIDEADACPQCRERRVDQLVWNAEGDSAACGSCGFEYRP